LVSKTGRVAHVLAPLNRLQLARRREPVEHPAELPEQARDEVLEGACILEPAQALWDVAGIADELLGDFPGLVVGCVQADRMDTLVVDPVVQRREVRVEGLRDRADVPPGRSW